MTTVLQPINTHALLNEAFQLQQKLNQALLQISTQPPNNQLESIANLTQLDQLALLQKKVERFFALMDTFDGEECVQISENLSKSVQVRDQLSDAQSKALSYGDLFADVQEAMRSKQNDKLNSLNARVTREISSGTYNQGIQQELLNLQANLREAILGNSASTVAIITAHSTSGQKVDELLEKCQKLNRELKSNLNQTFPLFLPFFKELHLFSQPEISQDIRFQELCGNVAKLLQNAIISQVEVERTEEMRQSAPVSSNGQNFVKVMKDTEKSEAVAANTARNTAFEKLSTSEKEKLLTELNKLKKNQIPKSFVKHSIMLWPASFSEKLQAAEKAFPTIVQSTQSSLKKSEQMKRELDEVFNLRVESQSQQALASINNDHSRVNLETLGILMKAIDELQKCINLLQKDDPESFAAANQILKNIADKKCVFAISRQEATSIAQRPHFHLYQIHRNEASSLLKEDANYGSKAFEGVEGFSASNTERMRSAQRAFVEVALSGLESAIHFGDDTSTDVFLNELEKIQLQSIDLPLRTSNIAHALFGTFYTLHVEARRSKSSLIDPHHQQFNGDFGRNAFKLSMTGIDNSIKLQTINQVRDTLKAVWKI